MTWRSYKPGDLRWFTQLWIVQNGANPPSFRNTSHFRL